MLRMSIPPVTSSPIGECSLRAEVSISIFLNFISVSF